MFSLFNFSSIFPGASADPICPYVRTPIIGSFCNDLCCFVANSSPRFRCTLALNAAFPVAPIESPRYSRTTITKTVSGSTYGMAVGLFQLSVRELFSGLYTGSRDQYGCLGTEWLACWTQAQKARVQIAVATLSGNSLRQTVYTHCASVHQAAKLVAALLRVAGGNCTFCYT